MTDRRYLLPSFIRGKIKKVYNKLKFYLNKQLYIKSGKYVELGSRFRFSRVEPFKAFIGDYTITDEFNVWNAKQGDIKVGKNCWFGLHNIVMGPVEIGNNVSTGPNISILGPRHAFHNYNNNKKQKTIIGNNVWISTGSIILSGTIIGDNAVIGPGSVITKDVPANAYMAGNPAKDLSKITEKLWVKK